MVGGDPGPPGEVLGGGHCLGGGILEREWLQILQDQNRILGWAVEATDYDHWTLNTILGLVVSCMSAAAWPPSLAPEVPTVLQQATTWAREEVLCYLPFTKAPGPPSLGALVGGTY